MSFVVIWSEQALKELSKLDKSLADRIVTKIEYANAIGTLHLEKVKGKTVYKYRVGTYRVFFDRSLHDTAEVIHIEHRKKAYKK